MVVINRTDITMQGLREWVDLFEWNVAQGCRSLRVQWNIEGHDDPLTLYANGSGTFIVEPGSKPVPAVEWLGA